MDLDENARLASLISAVPAISPLELWAADVLYVALRNFGILWLAGRKRYVFGYDLILEALSEEGVFDGRCVPYLRQLRFLKALYRSNEIATIGLVRQMVLRRARRSA